MSIFKRGNVYWYHFLFAGEHVQKSTKQGNPRVARQMEAAHRTALAKGEVGIVERKPVPTLGEFIENRFTPWARATFEQASPKTWKDWYRPQLGNICSYSPLVNRKLDTITSEHACLRSGQGMEAELCQCFAASAPARIATCIRMGDLACCCPANQTSKR